MPTQVIIFTTITVGLGIVVIAWLYSRAKYHKTKTAQVIKDKVILNISVPRNNDKSPLAAEQLYASLHGIGLNKAKSFDHFSLEIAAGAYGIFFICAVDRKYKTFIENQIYSQYPEAQIEEVGDYADSFKASEQHIKVAELKLAKQYYLPIRTFTSFDVDPLASITGAVSKLPQGQEVFIQIVARPIADSWQKTGKAYVDAQRSKADPEGKKIQLESGETELLKLIETKNAKVGFQFIIRILARTQDDLTSQRLINEVLASFGQYRTAVFNSLATPVKLKGFAKFEADIRDSWRKFVLGKKLSEKLSLVEKFAQRFLDETTTDVINTEELASLYHLPNKSVETPNISWAAYKKLEYPLNLPQPNQGARMIGLTDYRGTKIPFGIKDEDRLRHMYVIGKTGTGKSTFIESLIAADILDGKGIGFIDPHGEAINHILEIIPEHRIKDVVLFDPGDTEFPIGFNLLETKPGEDKSLIADGIVSVFKKQFGTSWGPRLEYILTNAILTLLHCQNVSLLVLPRLLSDDNYRKFLLKQLRDPILLKFWEEEYAQIAKDPKRKSEETASILNKVGRFTTNPLIRNVIGQVTSSIDLRDIMDSNKIFLVNLAQGRIGEENMALLGGMLITKMYSTVTQRINTQERPPFYLYVDEFQNFSNSTFAKILSEARKFGLGLTIAHQFIDQIDEDTRNAIFGNVGTIINFTVGQRDAEVFARQYSPYVEPEDLVNIGKHRFITKLSIDISQSKPFTAMAVKPEFANTGMRQRVIDFNREEHAKPRADIETKIFKWAGQVYNKEGNLHQGPVEKKSEDRKPKAEVSKSKEREEGSE